jgi:hypothetical protein
MKINSEVLPVKQILVILMVLVASMALAVAPSHIAFWNVGAPTTSVTAAISTTVVTNLQSLASFTADTYVEIQANAKIHYAKVGTASSTMQNCSYLAAGEVKGFRVGTSTFNLSIIADSAAVASLGLTIYPLN